MKESVKAKRIKRHQRRSKNQSRLNLVSLMDIFTILVFFLMVNSTSDIQVLDQKDNVVLPVSNAKKTPENALAIAVTLTHILVAGRAVVSRSEFDEFPDQIEPKLKTELQYHTSKLSSDYEIEERSVIIVADRGLHYDVLKKVMATCVEAGYGLIALAVSRESDV